jgi:hypothetical protein
MIQAGLTDHPQHLLQVAVRQIAEVLTERFR